MQPDKAKWMAACFLAVLGGLGCEKRPVATAPAESKQPKVLATWSFDASPAGQLPERFVARQNNPTKELAAWKVQADPQAPTPPNMLTVETRNDNATFNLLLAEGLSAKDLVMTVQVRGNTGEQDQGGGLIWRAKDENNYYVCRANPLETNFRVYKVVGGKRKQLQSAEGIKTEAGKWHEVGVRMIGDHITCSLDGKWLIDVHDDEFKDAGTVGLWTKADASSSFDDLVVAEPGPAGSSTKPE